MRKPRTITGRVAQTLRNAVSAVILERGRDVGVLHESNVLRTLFMVTAEQAGRQGLEPADLDNDQGDAVLRVIFSALPLTHEPKTIYVTPAWRRVVVSACRDNANEPKRVAWRADLSWSSLMRTSS